METFKRIARKPAFWIAISAIAVAAGLPKPIADLLPIVGPEIVETTSGASGE